MLLSKFAVTLLAAVETSAVLVDPAPNCCSLFREPNYEGQQVDVCYDEEKYGPNGKQEFILPEMGDDSILINSWWCGAKVKYDFCNIFDDNCAKDG